MNDGKRLDHFVPVVDEGPIDIGWAIVVVHVDNATVTRTCKGCGVAATTPFDRATGEVIQAEIHHRDGCQVVARLGNNAVLS